VKQLIIPWLATFLFGCAVFVVGKILQRQEKEARKRRAEALKARGWNPGMSLYFEERPTATTFAGKESARAASASTASGWRPLGRA
jgi:hypothetical protein